MASLGWAQPLPLPLTQQWVSAAFREVTVVWWQHQCRVRAQEGRLMQARVAGRGMRNRTWKALSISLSCHQFSFALRRQLFFLIIASTEHIFWPFGVVQSGELLSLKARLLGNEKVWVWRKPSFCFSLMPYCLSGTDNARCHVHRQHPCLEGRCTLVKSHTRLSSWLQRNKSSRRHCCQEQRGHGASQLSPSKWSSLFTHFLPSMLIGAPDIPPSLSSSLMSPQGC